MLLFLTVYSEIYFNVGIYLTGFGEKDIMMIFQILSGVLHFGNVKINEKDGESSEMEVRHT